MTSISRLRSSGSVAMSSSVMMTVWPSSESYALAMSRYSTTSPHTSHTRLYRMRPLSLACTWWNLMSWSSVAL